MTEEEAAICFARAGVPMPSTGVRAPSVKTKRDRRVFDGPLDVTIVLHGHCPSKKNLWRRGAAGGMFLDADVKAQIDVLTTQALFQWPHLLPITHPNVTVRFFVSAARQDEDGLWTTILDCLQKAGVILNDNIAHFNGRKVHEPCEFVDTADERVEIRLEKK